MSIEVQNRFLRDVEELRSRISLLEEAKLTAASQLATLDQALKQATADVADLRTFKEKADQEIVSLKTAKDYADGRLRSIQGEFWHYRTGALVLVLVAGLLGNTYLRIPALVSADVAKSITGRVQSDIKQLTEQFDRLKNARDVAREELLYQPAAWDRLVRTLFAQQIVVYPPGVNCRPPFTKHLYALVPYLYEPQLSPGTGMEDKIESEFFVEAPNENKRDLGKFIQSSISKSGAIGKGGIDPHGALKLVPVYFCEL